MYIPVEDKYIDTLKKASRYSKNKYMCYSNRSVCIFDSFKEEILRNLICERKIQELPYPFLESNPILNLEKGVKSVDAWFEYEGEKILLEFKSGSNVRGISKKFGHSICYLSEFLGKDFNYFKEKYNFVLVVNNEKMEETTRLDLAETYNLFREEKVKTVGYGLDECVGKICKDAFVITPDDIDKK